MTLAKGRLITIVRSQIACHHLRKGVRAIESARKRETGIETDKQSQEWSGRWAGRRKRKVEGREERKATRPKEGRIERN